jgi:RNA polymerase sigma-70 factor (ECF subfamily)
MTPEQVVTTLVSQRRRFIAFAKHITGNQDMAEDVVQDSYILAFNNAHQFTGDQPWKWMNQIIVNRFRSILRREKWYTGLDNVADPVLPESGIDSVYIDQVLHRIGLCSNGHLLLELATGTEYLELAHSEGIPEGTLKSRTFRAREKLMRMLPEEVQ